MAVYLFFKVLVEVARKLKHDQEPQKVVFSKGIPRTCQRNLGWLTCYILARWFVFFFGRIIYLRQFIATFPAGGSPQKVLNSGNPTQNGLT